MATIFRHISINLLRRRHSIQEKIVKQGLYIYIVLGETVLFPFALIRGRLESKNVKACPVTV